MFYVRDWLSDPQLKMASHLTKGIWMDLLCYMWEAPQRGKIIGTKMSLAQLIGTPETNIEFFINDCKALGFADVTESNGQITIINRRMYDEEMARATERERTKERVRRFRMKRGCNAHVTTRNEYEYNYLYIFKEKKYNISSNRKIENVEKAFYLAHLLRDEILDNDKSTKVPSDKNIDDWAYQIDLLIRKDKREPNEIEAIIKWCQADDFWQSNILSIQKLRKQYDTLKRQMKRKRPMVEWPDDLKDDDA